MMKVSLGSDHAGYKYKELVKRLLIEMGYEVHDFGTDSAESCDYPDYVRPAAESVATGESNVGFVFGGSGNGEAIVANKVKGIRCAVCWSVQTAEWAKGHNDANMIAIGERTITPEILVQIMDTFLSTEFEGGRHQQRVLKIEME